MKDSDWIVWDISRQQFLANSFGDEFTSNVKKAYGWHYKAECQEAVKYKPGCDVGRRKDFGR